MPHSLQTKLIDQHVNIAGGSPDQIDFLHAILCMVGLPRTNQKEIRLYTHTVNRASLLLEAGHVFSPKTQDWEFVPLPYGTYPRLALLYICNYAVKHQTPSIDLQASVSAFIKSLGVDISGGTKGGYTRFKNQIIRLAACRMTLGYMNGEMQSETIKADFAESFEAWLSDDDRQATLWPAHMRLSNNFFEHLLGHAVPLDHRAISALQHCALKLDLYAWLAHRLCRIDKPNGVFVHWRQLLNQFMPQVKDEKGAYKRLKKHLREVLLVYPNAQVESVTGGIRLNPSPPPISKTLILL